MATDNPRAVDDLTLSKSKKTRLTVWFLYFSSNHFNLSLVTFYLTISQIEPLTPSLRG